MSVKDWHEKVEEHALAGAQFDVPSSDIEAMGPLHWQLLTKFIRAIARARKLGLAMSFDPQTEVMSFKFL